MVFFASLIHIHSPFLAARLDPIDRFTHHSIFSRLRFISVLKMVQAELNAHLEPKLANLMVAGNYDPWVPAAFEQDRRLRHGGQQEELEPEAKPEIDDDWVTERALNGAPSWVSQALWGDHGELDDPPDSPDHALGLCSDGVELKVERTSTPAKPLYTLSSRTPSALVVRFDLLLQDFDFVALLVVNNAFDIVLRLDVGHLVVIGRTSMLVFSFFERLQDFADVSTSHDGVAISKLVFNPVFTLSSSLSPACRQNYRVDCDVAPKPVLVLDATSGKVVLLLLVIAGAGTLQPVKHLSSSGK
ncbi:hypothetical protein BDZ89DRAFT_1142974 [Hymenopellis radicata]|nr:hypothetical protein BDZ89DRAFT_1142974 [Hymenopellis radicata]